MGTIEVDKESGDLGMLTMEELVKPVVIDYLSDVASLHVNSCDIDDMVQDTLVLALQHMDLYKPGNLYAWLGSILRNRVHDAKKRNSTALSRRQGYFRLIEYRPEFVEDIHPLMPERDDGLSDEMKRALLTLTPNQRRVLLNRVCGMTFAACAEELGCSIQATRALLFHARSRMKAALAES